MKSKILTMVILAALALTTGNAAMADGKIAIVDVQAVVSKSAQVQALKNEQKTKLQELEKWVKVCKSDIEKQKTQEGKDKLAKKYDGELKKKQEAIAKNYKEKLQAVDKSISETIANVAKTNGYDVVISKGVVVYGGQDITEAVMKVVK